MELLILDTLDWRMRSITPFSFVRFFISLSQLKDPALTQTLKDRATEIIFKAQNGNRYFFSKCLF
jgi:cyclin D6